MKPKILSVDCANKSFAYVWINSDIPTKIEQNINNICDSIKIDCDVIDILDGKKLKDVDKVTRAKLLYSVLNDIVKKYDITKDNTVVIIEDQPATNFKSTSVQDNTIMYFAEYEIILMNPNSKNKINFTNKTNADYKKQYAKAWDANKNHSKDNLLSYLTAHNCSDSIKSIKKKEYHNIADSLMQAIKYIEENST